MEYDSAELDQAAAVLERLADTLGLPENHFDDLVYSLAAALALDGVNATEDEDKQEALIDESEVWAERINSDGRLTQIRYILGNNWPSLPLDQAFILFRRQITEKAAARKDN